MGAMTESDYIEDYCTRPLLYIYWRDSNGIQEIRDEPGVYYGRSRSGNCSFGICFAQIQQET